MMRLAIAEAHASRSLGNKGYGAVMVMAGDIVASAHDTCVTQNDPSLHAEMKAIRGAAQSLGTPDLCGAILFSSCEPCPMCASLAVWANVTAIVFGASIDETAKLGKQRIGVGCREIVDRGPALVEVFDGVLRSECLALYE
jgi:tRNA(Arg) A34 adenosine deaminase TadA